MKTLEWKEPPPRANSDTQEAIAQLQANPGRWARVQKEVSSSAASQKWKNLGCEATHRKVESADGKPRYDVYARWPEPKKPAAQDSAKLAAVGSPHQARNHPPAPRQTAPVAESPDPGLNKYLEERRRRNGA